MGKMVAADSISERRDISMDAIDFMSGNSPDNAGDGLPAAASDYQFNQPLPNQPRVMGKPPVPPPLPPSALKRNRTNRRNVRRSRSRSPYVPGRYAYILPPPDETPPSTHRPPPPPPLEPSTDRPLPPPPRPPPPTQNREFVSFILRNAESDEDLLNEAQRLTEQWASSVRGQVEAALQVLELRNQTKLGREAYEQVKSFESALADHENRTRKSRRKKRRVPGMKFVTREFNKAKKILKK
ncbi:MAG: uncharacterized protein KVP18_004332 [Porospora cf. gigantea A]|nr:MAG: hypothetical protein KVP18_004332 [Porospora cf. gigantea A]